MLLPALARLKPYLRWAILGATLIFMAQSFWRHWDEVLSLPIDGVGWICLVIALGVTLLAHLWSGWVWSWVLQAFNQPVRGSWSTVVYLQTNLAKYLPGNVWHFYRRVRSLQQIDTPLVPAIFGVLLEPLLMAAAALMLALLAADRVWPWQGLLLGAGLLAIHPRCLNPLLLRLGQSRLAAMPQDYSESTVALKSKDLEMHRYRLRCYPLKPLLGELGFVLLRGVGFGLVLQALVPLRVFQLPSLLGGFSVAWLLGLLVPGAPGGLGVFEATAVALLQGEFSPAVVLSGVALYRLISILAEAIGAGLATLENPSRESLQ